jgi:hypothetical protein
MTFLVDMLMQDDISISNLRLANWSRVTLLLILRSQRTANLPGYLYAPRAGTVKVLNPSMNSSSLLNWPSSHVFFPCRFYSDLALAAATLTASLIHPTLYPAKVIPTKNKPT